ncbi:MAG: hypothetical protein ABF297_05355 [Thiogranum sp.]
MTTKNLSILIAVIATLTLTGAKCAFVAKSGTGTGDKEDENRSTLVVVISDGRLIDGPVQGVRYLSGSVSGITGSEGEFQYEEGNTIRFFIGDIALGGATPGKAIITPLDLVPGGTLETPAVINIARLLQSLDAEPGGDGIRVPGNLQAAAVQSNDKIAASIHFLDFADEAAFVNAASQLIATLTASYPFTAVLVDAETAREHLSQSIQQLNGP